MPINWKESALPKRGNVVEGARQEWEERKAGEKRIRETLVP